MIPHLLPLRENIWLKIIVVILFSTAIAGGVYYASTTYLQIGIIPSLYLTSAITVVTAIAFGKYIATSALKSTDFLVRAILIGVSNADDIDRPADSDVAKPSREFLAKLAERVMDLGIVTQEKDKVNEQELVFYRTAMNVSPLPMILTNTENLITFANEAAIKYLELPANDIIGQYFYDACNLSFVSDLTLEAWLQSCREGSVVDNEVWERVRLNLPDNKRKQFDLAAHYRKDDSSTIELAVIFFDRTMQYERDDHDLSFVSLAVHELRTPLTIMRGYIEVFEEELSPTLTAEQQTFMHNMAASAQQLTAFVSNILNVARVEENALYLHLKEESWNEVLTQACKDMQLRAQVHDKSIEIEIADNLPTVAADRVSIYEVMNNLLDNAIKYTHTKEKIIVKTYLKDPNNIETTVTDRGVGIQSSLIDHVFDKFFRAHKSKNSVGGTGLGLYLCKSIISAHGGTIWVRSKEGEGSVFGFTLPTYASVAQQINKDDKEIIRGAHGWIKNHSLYRG